MACKELRSSHSGESSWPHPSCFSGWAFLTFLPELLRKAQELDIKLIAYPAHCTHVLQGLDVVCFAKLKKELADEIRDWNDCHQRGIQKRDFAGVFGRAYLRAFTPELVKSAWEAVGIHPYNPHIIPLDKLAPVKCQQPNSWLQTPSIPPLFAK